MQTQGTILRLGNTSSVKETLHDLILDTEDITSIQKLKTCIDNVRVVACTVLSASTDALLSHIEFDYCIVDEAGQITQPAIIGALMRSKRFVLVGDDYQLPPLVLSSEALNQGMDVSLFKRLAEAHPDAVVTLSEQYRMNMEIMEVSNTLIYDQRLICGSEDVAMGRLSLTPSLSYSQYTPWLIRCIEPEVPVVFVNTDNLRTSDGKLELESFMGSASSRGTVVNMFEVECISRIYHGLLSCGVDGKNIGVVSPYRSQVEALKTGIKSYASVASDINCLEVSTVDKFQGRDMDVMLLSLVRSNSHCSVGTLLRDWRRVNVAITRAKYKLVIVGSMSMTTHVPILKSLGELMKRREYVLQLERGDIEYIYTSRSDSLPTLHDT
jgi:DNA replication ATP-dependent helicase Dna2